MVNQVNADGSMKALVFKPKKVILASAEDGKIATVIPTAKAFSFQGKNLVAVPHRPDETIVMRNLGYDIPAPMNMYYPYKCRFTPFEAQKETAQFASMHRRCFILNSMGLGKTITALWATDYLRSIGQVHRTLIVCPISVMERTWADEIFRSFTTLKANVVYGPRSRRMKLLEDPADIYIVNTDAVGIVKDALAERPDIDHIIIDEVALFRNAQSVRWKALNEICNKQCSGQRRVWGLTGSPTQNSPTDAYGQIKLVNPTALPQHGRTFSWFRNITMIQLNMYKWVPKVDAMETVHAFMSPAIRYELKDVVELPPQVVVQRQAQLSADQTKAYKQMFSKLQTEVADGVCTASNEAIKASKLLQICSGVAYGENGEALCLNVKDRLATVEEVVDESEGKAIVFVGFSAALDVVAEHLRENHTVEVVDGGTSKAERDRIFYDFQNAKDPQVIVANPSTMSHGVTLTAATTIIWYTPVWSNEVYQQANARIFRTGQTRSTVVVQLVSSHLEETVYKRLDEKQSTQGALLDLVKTDKGEI